MRTKVNKVYYHSLSGTTGKGAIFLTFKRAIKVCLCLPPFSVFCLLCVCGVGRGVDILHSGLLFVVCVQGGGVEIKFAPFKQFVPISLCQLTTAISLSRLDD